MISFLISFATSIINYSPIEEKSFINWMRETNQFYSGDEYHLRFGIWQSNYRYIKEHNKKSNFQLGINRFAALTPAEYSSYFTIQRRQIRATSKRTQNRNYPASVDWRDTAVTAIRESSGVTLVGVYGALDAIEGSYVVNKKQSLQTFSIQELIDCCESGDPFEYLLKHDGSMDLENDYPFVGVKSDCQRNDKKAVGQFTDYVVVEEGDEEDLADKVANNGPIRAFVDATHASFMLYASGIYDEPQCNSDMTSFDVGVVGYGSEGNTKYWILKNHWGRAWGEEGFMRMIWNNNQCGVATLAFSVI